MRFELSWVNPQPTRQESFSTSIRNHSGASSIVLTTWLTYSLILWRQFRTFRRLSKLSQFYFNFNESLLNKFLFDVTRWRRRVDDRTSPKIPSQKLHNLVLMDLNEARDLVDLWSMLELNSPRVDARRDAWPIDWDLLNCPHSLSTSSSSTLLAQHGKSQMPWPLPNSSPSLNDCGSSWFKVSGRNSDMHPPKIPIHPSTISGSWGMMCARYTTNGASMLATYPMMWIKATPCARTTVGNNSAAYCSPML